MCIGANGRVTLPGYRFKQFYITLEGVLFWPSYILFGCILTSFIGTKRFYSACMDYHILWTFKCTWILLNLTWTTSEDMKMDFMKMDFMKMDFMKMDFMKIY